MIRKFTVYMYMNNIITNVNIPISYNQRVDNIKPTLSTLTSHVIYRMVIISTLIVYMFTLEMGRKAFQIININTYNYFNLAYTLTNPLFDCVKNVN